MVGPLEGEFAPPRRASRLRLWHLVALVAIAAAVCEAARIVGRSPESAILVTLFFVVPIPLFALLTWKCFLPLALSTMSEFRFDRPGRTRLVVILLEAIFWIAAVYLSILAFVFVYMILCFPILFLVSLMDGGD